MGKPALLSLLAAVWLLITPTFARAAQHKTTPPNQQKQELLPSEELLDFLGSFESPNEKWIDPMELDQIDLPKGENTNATK